MTTAGRIGCATRTWVQPMVASREKALGDTRSGFPVAPVRPGTC